MAKKNTSFKNKPKEARNENVYFRCAKLLEKPQNCDFRKNEEFLKRVQAKRIVKNKLRYIRKRKYLKQTNIKESQNSKSLSPKDFGTVDKGCAIKIVINLEPTSLEKEDECQMMTTIADTENAQPEENVNDVELDCPIAMNPVPGVNFSSLVSDSINWNCTIL